MMCQPTESRGTSPRRHQCQSVCGPSSSRVVDQTAQNMHVCHKTPNTNKRAGMRRVWSHHAATRNNRPPSTGGVLPGRWEVHSRWPVDHDDGCAVRTLRNECKTDQTESKRTASHRPIPKYKKTARHRLYNTKARLTKIFETHHPTQLEVERVILAV